jgi:ribosomal protein S20
LWLVIVAATSLGQLCPAQVCQGAADMNASVRSALETAAKRYFEMASNGDAAALKQNSIPSLAASFEGIESAVQENKAALTGAQATVRPTFLLTADSPQPLPRAEFLCGVFDKSGQTKDSAVFVLNNLPPGKYSVAILDVSGGHTALTLTFVLQQIGSDWKLAGFYARSPQVAGHDAAWFIQHAGDFKAKSQNHDAWLYYREAIALSAPVDFMSTLATDKLYDESQAAQPSDLPVEGKTLDMSAGGKVYHLTEMFPLAVGSDLDVVVKYQAADISDTARAFQENSAVIKALLGKYPELREAFAGVVARAVDPSGRDYGTLLAMKDVK